MLVLKSRIQNIVTKQTFNTTDNVNANIRFEREVAKVVYEIKYYVNNPHTVTTVIKLCQISIFFCNHVAKHRWTGDFCSVV